MAEAGAEFPTEGDSALLVAIPEAEPVVGRFRMVHDAVAAYGIPPHVTVLYPFVPRDNLSDEVREAVSAVFGAIPAFEYRFDRVARFGDTTVYLAPEPADNFVGLTDAVHARWPEHPPYGGLHDVVIPHLTVGDGLDARTTAELEVAARAALRRHGSIVGRAIDVALMIWGSDDRWSLDSRHGLSDDGAR
jgi:2'-5' RNA ligase